MPHAESAPPPSPLALAGRAWIHRAAHATGFSRRRAFATGAQRVLMLHGVGERGLARSALARLLRWVRRHAEPISLEEVGRRLADPDRVTGREIALTFDDGLANNARIAAPLLCEAGVPATFFVCPERIESGRWLWTHEARARLGRLAPDARRTWRREIDAPDPGTEDDIEASLSFLKTLAPDARSAAEDALRRATRTFEPTAAERDAYDMMTSDDLRRVAASGVAIGSHTRTHPILPTLSSDAIELEIAGARSDLEAILDRPVPTFCYPNGSEDARVREVVRRFHDLAVTTLPGTVRAPADPVALPRIGVVDSLAETTWRLFRP